MASFPLFPCFPVEIQLAVWAFAALLDPEPEVCLVWPVYLACYTGPGRRADDPVLPFIVDTDWPAVVHVCRVAREAAFKSGAVQLRHSPLAGFAVPYRHFMPAIDTLYCGRFQYVALCCFAAGPRTPTSPGICAISLWRYPSRSHHPMLRRSSGRGLSTCVLLASFFPAP